MHMCCNECIINVAYMQHISIFVRDANYMVPGSFSHFILVHWTRPTLKYANYMVPGSFSHYIFVHWTRSIVKYANYMVHGSFSRFIFVR